METTWNADGICSKHGVTPNERGNCSCCELAVPVDGEPNCPHLISGTCLRCESRPVYVAWKRRQEAQKAGESAGRRCQPAEEPRFNENAHGFRQDNGEEIKAWKAGYEYGKRLRIAAAKEARAARAAAAPPMDECAVHMVPGCLSCL